MKDVEKSRTSFIRVNLRVLREKHLFQCPIIHQSFFVGIVILWLIPAIEIFVPIAVHISPLMASRYSLRTLSNIFFPPAADNQECAEHQECHEDADHFRNVPEWIHPELGE